MADEQVRDDPRWQNPFQRTGYQCVPGGDACPGHPSKWLRCTPPEFAPAREATDEEAAAVAEANQKRALDHMRELTLRQKAAAHGGQTDVFDEARGHWSEGQG